MSPALDGVNGSAQLDDDTLDYARSLDSKHPLAHIRDEFVIPSVADLKRMSLERSDTEQHNESEGIYLCGNSLGLQPKKARVYVNAQLDTWATKGVYGHFKRVSKSSIPPWLQEDDEVGVTLANVVGAQPSEIVLMQTLTANLHLLLASFYKPTKDRYKIIIEGKAFPSDHFAVQSHLRHHDHDPTDSMVLIQPQKETSPCLTTSHICSVIDEHAESTAVLLLSGIQYYTGQFFDIKTITAHAQAKGIIVGWDLAHAAGNVPLQLHDWNVDFAAWCTYKYLNCGPGAIGGLFVHSRHTLVDAESPTPQYKRRLAGWWGSDKATRFAMENEFVPIPGAKGFQLSNPSALDMAAVLASEAVFAMTDIRALREKSLQLTAYLERLLDRGLDGKGAAAPWNVITPRDPEQRGAQLSVRLEAGLLDPVMEFLEENGAVVDERRPDVVRVAPAPLYNNWQDVWRFVQVFRKACAHALQVRESKS